MGTFHTHTHMYSPVATVSWRKDGSPLSASARVSFQQGGRILTIRDVSAGDGGSYTCVATQSTNMGPSTEEVSATLTVIGEDKLSSHCHCYTLCVSQ